MRNVVTLLCAFGAVLLGLSVQAQNSTIIPPVSTVNNYTVIATNTPTFWVSTNGASSGPGTMARPWNLTYAIANAGASNVIMMLPGTNYPTVFLSTPAIHNGLTLKSYAKWQARIVGQTSVHNIEIANTVSNCVIDGLDIDWPYINGIKADGGNQGATIQNCWIHHAGRGNPAWVTNGVGTFTGQGISATDCKNMVIRWNLIEDNGATVGHDHGIFISGTNHMVYGNVLRHNLAYGIQQFGSGASQSMNCYYWGNIVYDNDTGFGLGKRCATFYSDDAGVASWTNYTFNNVFVNTGSSECLEANGNGFLGSTNNTFVSQYGDCVIGIAGATLWCDYCMSTNTLSVSGGTVIGTHNLLTNWYGFVNDAKRLYWLMPNSPARGLALGGLYASPDFFGAFQRTNTDVGAVQFNTLLAGDTRDMTSTNGVDYWTLPSSYNSANVMQGLSYQTFANLWPGGPTNNIDLAGPGYLEYSSFTACQVSGVINKPSAFPGQGAFVLTVTLKLLNLSATNWNLTLPAAMRTRDGLRSYAVAPNQVLITSFCYDPLLPDTNSVNALNN